MTESPFEKLDSPIDTLPRTSPRTVTRLKSKGIEQYIDLLQWYPYRYEAVDRIAPIASLLSGEKATIRGVIESTSVSRTKSGRFLFAARIRDHSGTITVQWFNQTYLAQTLREGIEMGISGALGLFGRARVFQPIEYEIITNGSWQRIHTGRLVPMHSAIYGVSAKTIREKIFFLTESIASVGADIWEHIPEHIRKAHDLMGWKDALIAIHFPKTLAEAQRARDRLAFDELFVRMLSSALVRTLWKEQKIRTPFHIQGEIKDKLNQFVDGLPFRLTGAQERVVGEILHDLSQSVPMNRFLQGDVGAGKTVIAAIAAYVAWLNGFQTLLMAPTEILAQQHYGTLARIFQNTPVNVGIYTASQKSSKASDAIQKYAIMVGTHALINRSVSFDRVGLAIIDEQHRFGVRQRGMLKEKGIEPHLLSMTATPIPRTIALTLYSELDMSIIDELPAGRKRIKTFVVPAAKRSSCYRWIADQVTQFQSQVYVVCPLVEESEAETIASVRAATAEFERLKTQVFPHLRLGLLHGKMKAKEKAEIMRSFRDGKVHILVATSVVEVGVDVPKATIMLIEGAERFGLAQLHQMRGRVGRSDAQSYCYLFPSTKEEEQNPRLQFFATHHLGIELAAFDLKTRGAGSIYGTTQHGFDELLLADITDVDAVSAVREAVTTFINTQDINHYPRLKRHVEQFQVRQIARD